MSLSYLTTSQAAEKAGVSVRTIQRMILNDELPFEIIGTEKLIAEEELNTALERMSNIPKVGRAASHIKIDYWKSFATLLDWQGFERKIKPQTEQWFAVQVASACRVAAHIRVNQGLIGVDLTLGSQARAVYYDLKKQEGKIEAEIAKRLGEPEISLDWQERPNNAESWVLIRKESDVTNRLLWSAQHFWLSERFRAFYEVFGSTIKQSKQK